MNASLSSCIDSRSRKSPLRSSGHREISQNKTSFFQTLTNVYLYFKQLTRDTLYNIYICEGGSIWNVVRAG